MKLISTTMLIFSLLALSQSMEAKHVDIQFDRSIHQKITLDNRVDDKMLASPHFFDSKNPSHTHFTQQIIIENQGDTLVKNCLPRTRHQGLYTLENLAKAISKEDRPLLALYQLWTRSVHIGDSDDSSISDPLYILNFQGYANKTQSAHCFAKLCSELGINARPVSTKGDPCYDFACSKDAWEFLNPATDKYFLAWDNISLVSSEEVMDDPLLALRTKSSRASNNIDFKEAWKELAEFEITHPYLADELDHAHQERLKTKKGFDLYPQEQLIYHVQDSSINPHQCLVEHSLNLKERLNGSKINYSSPFPIHAIINNTDTNLTIKGFPTVSPGQKVTLNQNDLFAVCFKLETASTGSIQILSTCSQALLPTLVKGTNKLSLGSPENNSCIHISYLFDDQLENKAVAVPSISNSVNKFNQSTPYFNLESSKPLEQIWWQISSSPEFNLIPSNFEQVEPFTSTVSLPLITDTFLNGGVNYYFRVKGYADGQWSNWSKPFPFSVQKPDAITRTEFDKRGKGKYEISWRPVAGKNIEYMVFGSNSLDFIPSIYCSTQINAIVNGVVAQQEVNENLVAITQDPKIIVDGSLAYYRVIVRQGSQLSTPSNLIHVYDNDLVQTRNVLQVVEKKENQILIQRVEIPTSYSEKNDPVLDILASRSALRYDNQLYDLHQVILRSADATPKPYEKGPYISDEAWEAAKPYLLAENHPIRPKLDRIFSKRRVMYSSGSFKASGFKRSHQGRVSHILASGHPHLEGFFVKGFPDTDLAITNDWKKLIHRIVGANCVRECIANHGWEKKFKVPQKWLYPLPSEPSPPESSKVLRKTFVLIAEDMRILEHEKNNKLYKHKMDKKTIDMLFTILQEVGLYDSVYPFNVPFCKDGRLAFIDTEHHHRWPVAFHRFTKYFSKSAAQYWEKLIKEKGAPPQKAL